MRIRSFGWVALVAFAAIPVACGTTHATSDGVHNMTTNGGKECTDACKDSCCDKACKESCDKEKNVQNSYVAPECSKKGSCPMSGGNTPQ